MQKERVPYKEAGPNGEPSIEPILKAVSYVLQRMYGSSSSIRKPSWCRSRRHARTATKALLGYRVSKDFIYRWLVTGVRLRSLVCVAALGLMVSLSIDADERRVLLNSIWLCVFVAAMSS
jgi:hypothetical protein